LTLSALKIGHRVDERRGVVRLRIRAEGATIADDFEMSIGAAKRLAWAMLADLCPDELDEDLEAACDMVAAALPPTQLGGRGRCQCGARLSRPPQGKAGTTLTELLDRRLTAAEAARLIERSTSIASSFLVQLVRDGFAERVGGGLFGEPTIYAATPFVRLSVAGVEAAT
jgi:hypothetical protein